jgi:hypothetical protein
MAYQPKGKQPEKQEYDNVNRIVLFPTNAQHPKAPSHNGYLIITPEMLEENEDGTLSVNFVCWQTDENLISGVTKLTSEVMAEREAYKKSKEEEKHAKKGFSKGKK